MVKDEVITMKKRIWAYVVVILTICLNILGCGSPSAVQAGSESNGSGIIEDFDLQGFTWSGLDLQNGGEYIVTFSSDRAMFKIIDTNGNETSYEGTYKLTSEGLDINGIDIIRNPESIVLNKDGDKSYMIINDVMLTPSDISDIEKIVESLEGAEQLEALLKKGNCWMAVADGQAMILYVDDSITTIKTVASLGGGKVAVQDLKGTWGLNGESLSIYSDLDSSIKDFKWSIEENEDVVCIKLISDEKEAYFYQTKAYSIEDAIDMANQYIINQTSVEEIDDISHVLDGYVGVSIVDGMIYAGLDPRFENRKKMAEIAKIETYRGTAEQNLFLIEYMGGKIK